MKKIICTIIAKNYLAAARVLCNSFLEHHPDGICYVLIVDKFKGFVYPEKENFRIVALEDLKINGIKDLCFKYDITELCTAVKPFFLEYLFDKEKAKRIIYLDPDILITNGLTGLYDELDHADIILTPHTLKDYPKDGKLPNEQGIFQNGIFNLGFIGIKESGNTNNFLKWWQKNLREKCVISYSEGYFVDQRFIDFAAILFPKIKIMQDEGYNVAYWNLHSRRISLENNGWRCNGGKLYFYHFSGYKPKNPAVISKHNNRFNLHENPGLNSLFNIYRTLLLNAGYANSVEWAYDYDYFENGKKILKAYRELYRNKLLKTYPKNPFKLSEYSFYDRLKFAFAIFERSFYDFLVKLKKQIYEI